MVYESENIEFRSQMTDDIYRKIGENELQELLSVKHTRAYLAARQMCDTGLITAQGRGANKNTG